MYQSRFLDIKKQQQQQQQQKKQNQYICDFVSRKRIY